MKIILIIIFLLTAGTSCVAADKTGLKSGRYKELEIYFSPLNDSDFIEKEFVESSKTKVLSTELSYIGSMFEFLNEYSFSAYSKDFSGVNAKVMIKFYDPLEENELTLISDGEYIYNLQQKTFGKVEEDFLTLFSPAQVSFIKITSE